MKPAAAPLILWQCLATAALAATPGPDGPGIAHKVDSFGDPLPEGAVARLGTVRWRQGSGVDGMIFTPDGKTLISHGHDGKVYVWDAATGRSKKVLTWDTDWPAQAAACSPDGKILATGHVDYVIRLWDLETLRPLRVLKGHTNGVFALAFSPDGQWLASGARDKSVRIWDVKTSRCVHELLADSDAVYALVFSADSSLLVSCGYDRRLISWNTSSGEKTQSTDKTDKWVRLKGVSSDGRVQFTVTDKGQTSLAAWDPRTGMLDPGASLPKETRDTALSAAGATLAVAHGDKVSLVDCGTGKTQLEIPSLGEISRLAFAPDQKRLALSTGGPGIRIFDATNGKELFSAAAPREPLTYLRFLPDGKKIIAFDAHRPSLYCWEPFGRGLTSIPMDPSIPKRAALETSPDGTLFAVEGMIWKPGLPHKKAPELFRGYDSFGCFSNDGKLLAVAHNSGAMPRDPGQSHLRVLDVATGRQLHDLGMLRGSVGSLFFTPDGNHLGVRKRRAAWSSS